MEDLVAGEEREEGVGEGGAASTSAPAKARRSSPGWGGWSQASWGGPGMDAMVETGK